MDSGPKTVVKSSSDLPPPRHKKNLRPVSPPLFNVSMHRFTYYLALFAAILFAIYAYHLMKWKTDAGGWWNLALGKRPSAMHNAQASWGSGSAGGSGSEGGAKGLGNAEVEKRITELAAALGLPSKDLASVIAGAVKEYVPPASLSSIAAHQTGSAIRYIVDPSAADASGGTGARAYEAVASAFDAAIGMDEPPTDVVS